MSGVGGGGDDFSIMKEIGDRLRSLAAGGGGSTTAAATAAAPATGPATATAPATATPTTTATTSPPGSEAPADGEIGFLLQSLEDDDDEEAALPPLAPPRAQQQQRLLKRTLSGTILEDDHDTGGYDSANWYGRPLSVADALERMPSSRGGMGWYCTIIPDEFVERASGKLKRGLNRRDFTTTTAATTAPTAQSQPQQSQPQNQNQNQEQVDRVAVKPRRPSLPVTAGDFFGSLTEVPGPDGPRYIFYGVLNGWPSLRCFELESIHARRDARSYMGLPSAREVLAGQILWKKVWDARAGGSAQNGNAPKPPSLPVEHQVCRAKLRGAPWTSLGWSKDSPGFAFWYEPHHADGPRLVYGTDMAHRLDAGSVCTKIHMVSHRYAVPRESPRDRLTYHSVCFLEWDHGKYGTVVESAYLNGMGGYKGKSNWYDDRDERVTTLYKALPPEMICPWRTNSAEVRCYDVDARNLEELLQYMNKYLGNRGRFIDPQVSFSHRARLTFRSKPQVARYLLNYILRDPTYAELKRNCQTFAADLCSFLAGKRNVEPFHPVSQPTYQNRTYLFLYDSHLYREEPERVKSEK